MCKSPGTRGSTRMFTVITVLTVAKASPTAKGQHRAGSQRPSGPSSCHIPSNCSSFCLRTPGAGSSLPNEAALPVKEFLMLLSDCLVPSPGCARRSGGWTPSPCALTQCSRPYRAQPACEIGFPRQPHLVCGEGDRELGRTGRAGRRSAGEHWGTLKKCPAGMSVPPPPPMDNLSKSR